jgi:hypothetical protein
MLALTGVRHKVVVISACYSGVFIPPLANPNVLVITAADADHPSFGCRDKAKWTFEAKLPGKFAPMTRPIKQTAADDSAVHPDSRSSTALAL